MASETPPDAPAEAADDGLDVDAEFLRTGVRTNEDGVRVFGGGDCPTPDCDKGDFTSVAQMRRHHRRAHGVDPLDLLDGDEGDTESADANADTENATDE